jgi:cytochrome c oxidase subunit 2
MSKGKSLGVGMGIGLAFSLSCLLGLADLAGPGGLTSREALADGAQVIKISARRFEYIPNQITVKKNVPVVLQLTSQDRAHGIAIPALNLRSDIPPGKVTELKFTPQKSGDLKFYCDVFCGDGHDGMEGNIKVIN